MAVQEMRDSDATCGDVTYDPGQRCSIVLARLGSGRCDGTSGPVQYWIQESRSGACLLRFLHIALHHDPPLHCSTRPPSNRRTRSSHHFAIQATYRNRTKAVDVMHIAGLGSDAGHLGSPRTWWSLRRRDPLQFAMAPVCLSLLHCMSRRSFNQHVFCFLRCSSCV